MSGERHRNQSRRRLVSPAAAASIALALAGCGTVRPGAVTPPSGTASQAEGNWSGRERVREAIAHLNRGDAPAARRLLMALLRRHPDDAIARQLLAQIDTDPMVLLGRENYSYTLREGETLSSVAQRALGNPMMFYALARYNNIAVPTSVVPGQTILVPGRRPAPPPPPRQEQRPTPTRPAPEATAPIPRPAPRGNPAQAARLRGQGLAALSAGAINRAVALLRQALSLDPGNAVIRNDLARALRIQSTVRSRP